MTKIKITRKKRTGGQGEDDEESRSLHLSDLQGNESLNDISMISNASDDEHEIPETDLNISGVENDESGMTENESFETMNDFPSMEENEMNQTLENESIMPALNLEDLNASNASTNTTREEESFGGKRKTKKAKKAKKSKTTLKKSGAKSKNRKTKKHRKTLKKRHYKKKKGGFVGDNGTDMERYGETNPYSVERDSDPRY
uniref:Uncharacterized protein n=1 Tax=viral metagenome TaxID=1070528 RepID=A0A6C0DTA9_9ZZZZ